MKATLEKNTLSEKAQALEKVSGKNLNLDVLKCVLVAASKKDGLVLRATNLDIGIETKIKADVEEEGEAAVPAGVLSSFLNNTSGDIVTLTTPSDGVMKLKTTKTTTTINTVAHEDFPTFPKTKGEKIEIPTEKLSDGLRSVWYAASTSNMKPELSSVLVSGDGGGVKFVATDSFRLAEKKLQLDKTDKLGKLLIPLKNTGEIIRNLEKETKPATIVADNNQLSITFDNTHITSRLVDGTFPDYEQIIPTEHTTEAVVLKQDFIQALKTTNVFANKFNQTTLTIKPKKKTFVVKTTGGDFGESTATIEASLSGEEIEANFNQKYISDSLQSIKDDSVALRFFGQGKPMIIRGVGDGSFIYLTMPMNR